MIRQSGAGLYDLYHVARIKALTPTLSSWTKEQGVRLTSIPSYEQIEKECPRIFVFSGAFAVSPYPTAWILPRR